MLHVLCHSKCTHVRTKWSAMPIYIRMPFIHNEQAALEGESTRPDCCQRIRNYSYGRDLRRTKEGREQSLVLLSAPHDQSTTDSFTNDNYL